MAASCRSDQVCPRSLEIWTTASVTQDLKSPETTKASIGQCGNVTGICFLSFERTISGQRRCDLAWRRPFEERLRLLRPRQKHC